MIVDSPYSWDLLGYIKGHAIAKTLMLSGMHGSCILFCIPTWVDER
jgi:hypothetical protein